MSQLSDTFHKDLDDIKAAGEAILAKIEGDADRVAKTLAANAAQLVADAGPVIVQAAVAAVGAAIAAAPGGAPGALLAAAEAAALSTLKSVGKPILNADLVKLKAAVLSSFVQQVPVQALNTAAIPAAS